MVKIYDVILAIKSEIKKCVPAAKFYLGRLPENPSRPSFLFSIAFAKDRRSTFLTQTRALSIQIIHFGELDEDEKEDLAEQLKTVESLRGFLNRFLLKVGDRSLTFDFDIGSADEQLSILLDFKFKDSLDVSEEQFELIKEIFVNEEAIS